MNSMATRSDWALTDPHAGVMDHPWPVFPAGLLRSEPAAGPFKAAIAPRSGRNPADLGKAGPRPRAGTSEELAPACPQADLARLAGPGP